jgi:hypothetical protein
VEKISDIEKNDEEQRTLRILYKKEQRYNNIKY